MFNFSLNAKFLVQELIYAVGYKGGKILVIILLLLIIKSLGKVFISRGIDSFIIKAPKRMKVNQKERKETLEGVLLSVLNVSLGIAGFLTILSEVGINITPLLAGAGVIGLAISMGASNLVKDYISGFFILVEDQYRVGEKIEVSGFKGRVKDFDLRRTLLEDEDGAFHFIPNGQVTKSTNFSRKR